jgi:hypothetical protein
MTDQMDGVHSIFTDVGRLLRERLAAIGADVAHILVSIGPEGGAIVRGNVDPAGLREMGVEIMIICHANVLAGRAGRQR